nr:MAG TPA: hypothetical protein [Caudoviricetes sp.]
MVEINKSLNGTLDKAISASAQLKKMPGIVQDFMLSGDFSFGKAKKVTSKTLGIKNSKDVDSSDPAIQNLAAQLAGLDKSQQNAVLKMTDLNDAAKSATRSLLEETAAGDKLSASVMQNKLQSLGLNEANAKLALTNAGLIDSAGNYLVVARDQILATGQNAEASLTAALSSEDLASAVTATNMSEQQLASSTIAATITQQGQTKTTWLQIVATNALAGALAIAKQAAFALFIWGVSKFITYVKDLKTHTEELVETMNDSHDAAEQATKDVEEIQSKIDELNNSLEAAGVKKIEDIVDPAERERLQAINDMLQTQLELKKQLEKDANDKANADTSAVVNDKTEKSIYDFEERHDWTGDYTTGKDITKTESLQEYTAALEDTIQKRSDLQVELDQIEASSGKDSKEYANKKKELDALNEAFESQKTKVEELSTAVSEQMGNYKTDADSFAQYKDEYVAGTNAMTAATKALANAQDNTGIDTTNLDIFSEKVKQIKNDIDNGDSQQSDWKTFNGLDAFSGMSGEAIINIDKDSSHQTETETAALEKLHKTADENKISFESLIGVFESFGLVQISSSATADDYADKLEKTMSVIDNIQSAYKTCSSAVEEYNQYGYMSVDSLQALLQMDDQYLNALELVNGKLQVNQSAYADLLATQYAEAQMEAISQAISELNAIAKGDAAEKAETFTEATEDEKNKLTALCPALKDATVGTGELAAALAAAQGAANGEDADAVQAKIDGVMNALNTRLTLIGKNMSAAMNGAVGLRNQLDGFSNSSKKAADSSNKAADSSKTLLDAWSTLTSAMKEYNEQGYITFQTLKSLTDLEDKYSSMLKKNDVTGQLEMRTDDFYKLMKAELKEAQIKGDGASEAQYNKILEWTNRNIKKQTMSYWDLVAAIEGYSAALSGAKDITDTFKDAWSNGKTIKEKQEKSRAGALDYEGTEAQSSALQDLMKYSEYDPELIGKAFNKETGKIDLSGDMLKTAVAKSLKQQAAAARTEGGAAAEAIATSYEKSAENIENDVISVQDYFDGLGSTIEEVSSKIDELQSTWSDLSDVTNEYNTYGGLSVDSIQKLLTMSPEYLQFLKMDGDQLVFNRDAMLAYAKANLLTKAAELALKDETKAQAKILRALANSLDKGADSMDGMGSSAEKLKSGLSDLKDVFSSLLSLFEKFNTDKDNDLKLWGEAMTEDIDKRIEALNKQKEALEKANDEEERAITLAKLKAELEKARTQRTVRKLTSNGYEWVADESAVKEAKDNLSDQQREWRKEDAEKAIDDQIDKLNELKDKYSEAMNLIGTSLDDYNKKLRYAAQIQDMTFSEMEGRVDEYKNKIIASFTSAAPVSGIRNLISNIESLIDALTKLNNVYSWIQTGKYQDKGTSGLWNTIKGFFNKGKSENINKSFKDTFDAAKKAFNAGKKQLTDTATTGANDVINAIINQIKTSGNGLIETFSGIWKKIKGGAQSLFSGSGEGGGIVSTVVNGFKAIGNAVSKSKIGTAVVSGGGKLLAGAGKLIGTAGSALAAAGPYAIPIAAAAGLGIYSGVKGIKHQKEIWSNKEDGFGKKAIKSVASFFWDISPIGGIVNLCKDIFGKNKEIADNTKDNGKDNTSSGTKNSSEDVVIGNIKGKKAGGSRSIKQSGRYNVDERGPELLVRQPASGRYTYLETGDGVVPADITSRLFDMGGNPDRWFTEQMERNAGISNVQNRTVEGDKITIGDIYIQNPVGGVDDLAREINQRMPAMFKQIQSKR